MKTLKIATIATAITLALITLCGIATAETYEVKAVVTEIDNAFETVWIATAKTANGTTCAWFFDKADGETWHIGDVALVTYFTCEGEEDDEVMDVTFIGVMTPAEIMRWLKW